jgi:hypothetical protein
MYDIFHEWGSDLLVGSGGDLALAGATDVISQRICRRLLTNGGDCLWNLEYGGGLAQFIGQPVRTAEIEAVIRDQLALEDSIPASPAPIVEIAANNLASGYIIANITYTDPSSQEAVTLHLNAGP